jgi:cGMP-dependent protein kinase 2
VVNRLFKADYFGERALLSNEPRGATVVASQETVCLVLDRDTFVEILGPLDKVMAVSGPPRLIDAAVMTTCPEQRMWGGMVQLP